MRLSPWSINTERFATPQVSLQMKTPVAWQGFRHAATAATPPPPSRPTSPSGVELRRLKATMNYSNEGGWKFSIGLFLATSFWSVARSYGIPPASWLSSHGELCNEGARACARVCVMERVTESGNPPVMCGLLFGFPLC